MDRIPMENILQQVLTTRNVTPEEFFSRQRPWRLVDTRRDFAKQACDQGYSYPKIGRFMHLHHTSVLHLAATEGHDEHRTTPIAL